MPDCSMSASFEMSNGTKNYEKLENKPSINGVELIGNKTSADLGLATAEQGALAETALQEVPSYYVTETELASELSTKQNVINDLSEIREGASLGATSVQPDDISDMATKTWVEGKGYTSNIGTVTSVNGTQPDSSGNVVITIPAQVNADWNATSGVAEILNKPTIPTDTGDLTNNAGYIKGISGSDVTNALGYVPYNSSNPNGYITSSALNGYATESWVGQQGYLTGITGSQVVNALGFTPYDSSNPNGYTSNIGTVTSVNGNTPDSSGNVIITIPDSATWGNITGTLSNQTDLQGALNDKVNSSSLATVATSGNYNDLSNKPTIGNGTITFTQGGVNKGTITTNQSGNTTIALDAGSSTISVVQTAGDSETSVMSQKAVTYNTATQYGKCLQVNASNQSFNLTDEQVTRINNCDVISVRYVERGTNPSQFENRYVRIIGGVENNYGMYIQYYFDGKIYYRNYRYGQSAYAFNLINGTEIIPDVNTIVIDRINGIVKYYAGSTLITTDTADEYKSDYFIPLNQKKITLSGGDVKARFYDIQIYDTDITKFYNSGDFIVYNNDTSGAQTLLGGFHGGYQQPTTFTDATPSTYSGQAIGGWSYSFPNGIKTMSYTPETIVSNRVAGGYYIGGADDTHAYIVKSYVTVSGGTVKFLSGNDVSGSISNIILGIYDATTNQPVADVNNIGEGSYYIVATMWGVNIWWVQAVSGNPVVQQTKDSWKRVQCLFHLKGDVLYNNKLYDDEVDTFYALPANIALSSNELREPCVKRYNQQGIYPHYEGEIKVDMFNNANKIYCALNYTTWKQINNS